MKAEELVHLVLTYHWFDEMLAGRKDVEYRAPVAHWRKHIWMRRSAIRFACFYRGYSSTRIVRFVNMVDEGPCPHEGWRGVYYRLHLGPIMDGPAMNPQDGGGL